MTPDADLALAVLRVLTPLLLAALGVLISERAGMLNIGMEGIMLASALAAVLGSAWLGGPWVGLLAALGAGAGLGLLMALCTHRLGADVIVVGIALNLAAASGTVLVLELATGDKGMSGSLASGALPAVAGLHVLTWAALGAVPLVALVMRRTRLGAAHSRRGRGRRGGPAPPACRLRGSRPGRLRSRASSAGPRGPTCRSATSRGSRPA